jgi:predicted nucleic acid-binding protein
MRKVTTRRLQICDKRFYSYLVPSFVEVNTAESILQALTLEARYKISFWDALIIQAAGSAGATVLYSEDLAEGQSYGAVRVVNPLR